MQSGQDYPKPMARINGKPLIYHIMKIYSKYGFNEFILPLGYKGEAIRDYFINYEEKNCNILKETAVNKITVLDDCDNFKVTMIDTGIETMTGARIKRVSKYIDGDTFMVTYGDGLANIDINKLLKCHNDNGKIVTLTGVVKQSQYGTLQVDGDIVNSFSEKETSDGIINGGFFVCNNEFLDYLSDDSSCVLEQEPLKELVKQKQLGVYMHDGIWISVDTLKDLDLANELWRGYYETK